MGDMPWNRNEGKFDRPSSSVPVRGHVGKAVAAPRARFPAALPATEDDFVPTFVPPVEVVERAPVRVGFFVVEPPEPEAVIRSYSDKPGRRIRKPKGSGQ